MSEGPQNHYQVLRIERTADERAIKKAYFKLIREFTPEQHPEEFKRIREAYEVLSDPVARQRFDAADKGFSEYAPEVAAALADIQKTIEHGDEADAQAKIKALLREHPDIAIARENLGFSYLRTNAFQEALDVFKALAKEHPEEARYHLYKGLAFTRLDKQDKALVAVKKAHALKPDEVRFHVALIDLLIGMGDLDGAIAAIDDAIERHGPKSDLAITIGLRRLEALFMLGGVSEADRAATAFFEEVARRDDPELAKFVSSQLAAVAARLFARSEADRANAVLSRCEDVHPESAVDHPYPPKATISARDLPEAGRAWLAAQRGGTESPTLEESVWTVPVVVWIAASFGLAITTHLSFDAPQPLELPQIVLLGLLFAVFAGCFAFAARSAITLVTSPLRGLTTVHPLYIVRARGDAITLYPLFRITNLQGVHHHTNGSYTHTAVTVHFGQTRLSLSIRGRDYAQQWVDHVSFCRRRALELMMEGYLEAEHGVDTIPPSLLSKPGSTPRSSWLRWYGGAALAAAATLAVFTWLHERAADDYAFRHALSEGSQAAYRAYQSKWPNGRHAGEAQAIVGEQRAVTPNDPQMGTPGGKALAQAIDALAAAKATTLPVVMKRGVELPPMAEEVFGRAADAYKDGDVERRERALVDKLERGFKEVRPGAAFALAIAEERAASASPARVTIEHVTKPAQGALGAGALPKLPLVTIVWEIQILLKDKPEPLWKWQLTTEAPPEVQVKRPFDTKRPLFASAVLSHVEVASFDAFAQALSVALGVRAPAATQPASRSPYERR